MAVTLTQIKSRVYELLNVSKGDVSGVGVYGTFDGDPRYKELHITDLIYDKCRQVIVAIAETDNHPHIALYTSTITEEFDPAASTLSVRMKAIADGISKPQLIRIRNTSGTYKVGKSAPSAKIDEWSASSDADVVTSNQCYYDTVNGHIYYSGTGIKIQQCVMPTLSDSDLKVPDEMRDVVAALTLSELYSKQEEFMQAASWYGQIGQSGIMSIREGKTVMPELQAYQAGR